MFGFLAPTFPISRWRQSYARICQTQRHLFGITSLPFLSYEATFLYQLMVDFSLVPPLASNAPLCCRLRRLRNVQTQPDAKAASFAAAFGLLLAGIKLRDDVTDHGQWHNHLLLWKYKRQIQKAHDLLDASQPGVIQKVNQILDEHREMESSGRTLELQEFTDPTARGFALMYRAAAEVMRGPADEFEQIGHHVGWAIVTWDCAVDFHKDRIRGEFNPLRRAADITNALQHCRFHLSSIGWMLDRDIAVCQTVIESVADRVHRRLERPQQHADHTSRLERWGLIRARGYQYARCDGCEALCAIGECSECACAGGEAIGHGATCCAGGATETPCCCDACCLATNCGCNGPIASNTSSRNSDKSKPSAYERFHGQHGSAVGDLKPQGLVEIDGHQVPARTIDGQFIAAGTVVRIVRTDPLGVTVKAAELPLPEDPNVPT